MLSLRDWLYCLLDTIKPRCCPSLNSCDSMAGLFISLGIAVVALFLAHRPSQA